MEAESLNNLLKVQQAVSWEGIEVASLCAHFHEPLPVILGGLVPADCVFGQQAAMSALPTHVLSANIRQRETPEAALELSSQSIQGEL